MNDGDRQSCGRARSWSDPLPEHVETRIEIATEVSDAIPSGSAGEVSVVISFTDRRLRMRQTTRRAVPIQSKCPQGKDAAGYGSRPDSSCDRHRTLSTQPGSFMDEPNTVAEPLYVLSDTGSVIVPVNLPAVPLSVPTFLPTWRLRPI